MKEAQSVYELFEEADTDRSGTISKEEFINFEASIGVTSEEEALVLFAQVDTDKNGEKKRPWFLLQFHIISPTSSYNKTRSSREDARLIAPRPMMPVAVDSRRCTQAACKRPFHKHVSVVCRHGYLAFSLHHTKTLRPPPRSTPQVRFITMCPGNSVFGTVNQP